MREDPERSGLLVTSARPSDADEQFAEQAVAYGLATPAELEEIATAWRRWRDADDGWLGMLHGELLIRV